MPISTRSSCNFHGGGFVLGDLDTHDGIVRRLALASGLRFVSVGYRRAPEHPYPAPLDDCVAAVRWVADHLRPSSFGLAGDSAGANLAFGAALTLREHGLPQAGAGLLIFGCYDRAMRAPSYTTYGRGDYLLRTSDVDWFWRQYLGEHDARPPAPAAPIDAPLDGLPPVFIGAPNVTPSTATASGWPGASRRRAGHTCSGSGGGSPMVVSAWHATSTQPIKSSRTPAFGCAPP